MTGRTSSSHQRALRAAVIIDASDLGGDGLVLIGGGSAVSQVPGDGLALDALGQCRLGHEASIAP